MLLWLIGLSGTGKSTVGPLLAERLGVPFVDTDSEIERISGRAIPEVFQDSGESSFRALEREAIAAACRPRAGVVATGGGAPLDPANRARLREAGTVLWLDAPTDVLVARLAMGGQGRPLLAGDPRGSLERLRAEREATYTELGRKVDASGEPEEVVGRILTLLSRPSALSHQQSAISTQHAGPSPQHSAAWVAAGTAGRAPTYDAALSPQYSAVWVRTPSQTYPVYVGSGLIDRVGAIFEEVGLSQHSALSAQHSPGTLHVVADEHVDALHGARLRAGLGDVPFTWHVMPAGEEHKTLEQAQRLYDELLGTTPERQDIIVAFGGGVVGDLAGFVAATLLRGLRLVQIPTTVLSQVDSSVGGKVAVDHPRGKNLIGAFHQPSLVVADVEVLRSLPVREVAAGWAEVVKIAVIQDAELFSDLERDADALLRLDPAATSRAIRRAVELKARVVESDERDETGARAILNYGHTLGHAAEAATGYAQLLHGEAVAIGMRAAAHLARGMGLHPEDAVARQSALLDRLGLPRHCAGASPDALRAAMGLDKKRLGGRATWVLPAGLGHVCLRRDVPDGLVDEAIALAIGTKL